MHEGPVWKLRELETWNALFWLLLLFNAIIATSKTFANETKGRMLYNYTLYHPRDLLIAKLIYNFLVLTLVSLLCYLFFALFIGNPVKNIPVFFSNLIFSCMAFSGVLTMTSGIASKAGGGFTLISILSIPLLFPMLLLSMRSSLLACLGNSSSDFSVYLIGLLALSVLIVSLGVLLFPYLWKE
jgi:heme exporter protein B